MCQAQFQLPLLKKKTVVRAAYTELQISSSVHLSCTWYWPVFKTSLHPSCWWYRPKFLSVAKCVCVDYTDKSSLLWKKNFCLGNFLKKSYRMPKIQFSSLFTVHAIKNIIISSKLIARTGVYEVREVSNSRCLSISKNIFGLNHVNRTLKKYN